MDNARPNPADAPDQQKSGLAVPGEAAAPMPRLSTSELFRGGRELMLLHNGREYHLRITQQGKLLLTA